jgi:hypothetical protein
VPSLVSNPSREQASSVGTPSTISASNLAAENAGPLANIVAASRNERVDKRIAGTD